MITTGFDARVKVQQIIDNQLPEFLTTESPKALEFLKQYYISQEYQGGPIDIAENLDQYLNLNNLTPEVVVGITSLTSSVSSSDDTIYVESTKGYPQEYGLLKIGDEIVTYTGLTTNTFTGCVRGFSGITTYRDLLNPEELIFSTSSAAAHADNSPVNNLSALFLKEFYKKIKYLLAPGFEDIDFVDNLDVNKFIKQIRDFYQAKGTDEAFRILFNVLYGHNPKVINLEDYLLKPSDSDYIRRQVLVTEVISGDPNNLVGEEIKSSDGTASGPVSEVEIISRGGKQFYKIQLFSGFNDKSLIEGTFDIGAKSKVGDTVSIGSSVITVDSTIGFPSSGTVISGLNTSITYTSKSVNQFFGCSGVTSIISPADAVRSDYTVIGYENGDTSKKVVLRVTGVLSDIENQDSISLLLKNQTIPVKNLGESIENNNSNFKEFAFNTWLYNTSSRYEIDSFTPGNNQLNLFESPDKSSLKEGDHVDILDRNAQNVLVLDAIVSTITNNILNISKIIPFGTLPTRELSLRRRFNYTTASSNIALDSPNILSNIQSTYNENDQYLYTASNSLPDYNITKNISSADINITSSSVLSNIFQGYDIKTDKYSVLSFNVANNKLPFITGDAVVYTGSVDEISGLTFGQVYYVEILRSGSNTNQLRLYNSRSFIGSLDYVQFKQYAVNSTHTFTLQQHYNKKLSAKKVLSKFPLNPNIESGSMQKTVPGRSTGMLINGVEIANYKSNDKIYYGPLESVKIYNGGTDYNVINPPTILAAAPTGGIGTGANAVIRPVIRGSVKEIQVDPQETSFSRVLSVTIDGGNGDGAVLEPVISKQYKNLEFSGARTDNLGGTGGVDISEDNITFTKVHNISDGTKLVYDPNGNNEVGIGSFGGSNTDQGEYLISGAVYYPRIVNTSSIRLYKTEADYLAGINTVGFTTIAKNGNGITPLMGGIHKFRVFDVQNVISEIKVLNSGSGYENRRLTVNSSGIKTETNYIYYKNHGFNDGDIVEYSFDETTVPGSGSDRLSIDGISNQDQYYVLKVDDNNFQLADTGITDVLGSVRFDGISDRYDFEASTEWDLKKEDFTIECWIKTATATADGGRSRRIWMTDGPTGNAANNFQFMIDNVPAGKILVFTGDGQLSFNGTSAVNDNKWHHIAVVRSDGRVAIFVDGKYENSELFDANYSISPNNGSPRPRIGSYDGTNGDFNGEISNFRLVKGRALYWSDFTPSKHPLKNVDGTILLFCKDGSSELAFDVSASPFIDLGAGAFKQNPFRDKYDNVGDGTKEYFYNRRKYALISGSGSDSHQFSYPPIKLNINAEWVGKAGIITAIPIVRGEIVDTYLDNKGSDYGSSILNFHRDPTITIKNGIGAQFNPIISGTKIVAVQVQRAGEYYNGAPDLIVTGEGTGAKLRATVEDGKIKKVIVLNGGIGYKPKNTSVSAVSAGRNAVLEASVRSLTVNNFKRFGDEIFTENGGGNLSYGVVGYSTDREGVSFIDPNPDNNHSRVIGWAYDGNPIYGPFGYSDPEDDNSAIVRLDTSYSSSISNIENRPPTSDFELGYFVEDYKFDGNGHLDDHNGRFTKTPEYPNGVYAYHVGVTTDTTLNRLAPEFPYFIGDTFRSNEVINNLDQSFDFNSSSLIRNTFPYRVNKPYSGNEFLFESNEKTNQISIVESASVGSIDSLKIINKGTNYRVGNSVIFDNTDTGGGAASAEVTRIDGKAITNIETSYEEFENSVLTWENQNTIRVHTSGYHGLVNGDRMEVSGLSTFVDGVSVVTSHIIGVSSETTSLLSNIPTSSGIVTDIYVSSIPPLVGAGSSIGIGTETFGVLGVPGDGILRVKRQFSGWNVSHDASSIVSYYPDTFTIPVDTEYFDSTKNYTANFNPTQSVGIGTTAGFENTLLYNVGIAPRSVSVPTQSIYVPNHPFKNNERVLLTVPAGGSSFTVGMTSTSNVFNLPLSGSQGYVYVINKSRDFIGLATNIGVTTGLYFRSNGSNSNEYSLQTEYSQVTSTAKKIKGKIGVSTFHNLTNSDQIDLHINPSLSVGIGVDQSVRIKYNTEYNKILVNPVGFASAAITIETGGLPKYQSAINIPTHGFKSGDKVFYEADELRATGLNTGGYFVYRVDANYIKLCETYSDVFANPPVIVGIAETGGLTQRLSLINPQITVTKNNNLVFDVSDTSLTEYDFNFYYDKGLNNEFVSTGTTSVFSVSKSAVIGVSSEATYTIGFNDDMPTKLYYSFSKKGVSIDPDVETNNYSEILYTDSSYNGKYNVFGVGSTDFYISLREVPERLSYSSADCDVLNYDTSSKTASGPVNKIDIISKGDNYQKLPRITGLTTGTSDSLGNNAIISAKTNSIGKLNRFRIVNEGFEYSADKTLRPSADVASHISLDKAEKISQIKVASGGRNYLSAPQLVIVNTYTGNVEETGILKAIFNQATENNAIVDVEVVEQPKGLSSVDHKIYTINNSNGVQVNKINEYNNGIVECQITTPPVDGFVVPPFAAGDKIFVEGLIKGSDKDPISGISSSPGTGFNSTDNGYNFFEVVEYINSNPAILKYDVAPYTDNAGNHKTNYNTGTIIDQTTQFNAIIKQKDYPTFEITKVPSEFYIGEKLVVNGEMVDLTITIVDSQFIKVIGTYELEIGDRITGNNSGNTAIVSGIDKFNNRYTIDYANRKEFGWKDGTGKLNDDLQVLPDNDYYQNLSYTIKSPVTWDTMKDSVNKLVHPSGMKNFADTEIISKAVIAIGVTQSISPVMDFVSTGRIDTISNFDLALDYNPTSNSSRYIIFKNKKLTDYITCNTNRVLQIDDISNDFSSSEFNKRKFADAPSYPITDFYAKYLVQVSDIDKISSQLSEVVVLNDFTSTYTLNKGDVYTGERLGVFGGELGDVGDPLLRFTPDDPNNFSYNLKIYKEEFANTPFNIGVGVTDIGSTRLSAKTERVGPASGSGLIGFSTDVFRSNVNDINTFYANAHVINETTNEQNYFEIAGYYDGTNSYIAEYYFDTTKYGGVSSGFIGTFGINVSSGVLGLTFKNSTQDNVLIKTKTVGIGSTQFGSGIGTHRFNVAGQTPGSERTARLQTNIAYATGITTITTLDQSLEFGLKSIVKVSVGSTVDVHNVLVIADQQNAAIQQSQFLSGGSNTGIGSFSTSISGTTVSVLFHPDARYSSDQVTVQSFNQYIYSDIDNFNVPSDFTYGTAIENISNAFYGSINEFGKDRLAFDLLHKGVPIFEKTFNPSDTTKLNRSTGIFSIDNHFFETGEKLIYTPDSSLIGISGTAISIGATITSGAIFTGDLIAGFSTITGIAVSTGLVLGSRIYGESIDVNNNTTITGINTAYTWFNGNLGAAGTVITGIGNTSVLTVGAGIHSGGTKADLGTIYSIGINSITVSSNITNVGTAQSYYSTDVNWSVNLSNAGSASTIRQSYSTGITTNICPSLVYAIKLSKDTFKITGTAGGNVTTPGIGFTFTDVGNGNVHKLEMDKKLEKSLITVDGVTQYPLIYTPLTFDLKDNPSTIGAAVTFISLSGISSIKPSDILKVDDEYMKINNVGFGTTTAGPITGIGSANVIEVTRGFVGSSATTHTDGTSGRIYKGAFNIVGTKIHFTQAPDGRGSNNTLNSSALPSAKSTFNGRVYLRTDYTDNKIYDDISHNFNGIGQTFTVYKEGKNVTGMQAGSDVLFINDVFQTPDTENNIGKNYKFSAPQVATAAGLSSVTFTGVKRPGSGNDDAIIVDYDINQNQLPRGGVVISIGSSGGLGYAPLVGAAFTIGMTNKSITSVGIGTSGSWGSGYQNPVAIGVTDQAYKHKFVSCGVNSITANTGSKFTATLALYESHSGICTLTIPNHGLTTGNTIGIATGALVFSCDRDNFNSNHAYPRTTDPAHNATLAITSKTDDTITVGVGSGGGSGTGAVVVATVGARYNHRFVTAAAGAAYTGGEHNHTWVSPATNSIVVDNWGGTNLSPTGVGYTPSTGDVVLTFGSNHNLTAGSNTIGIRTESLIFTCDRDNNVAEKKYPRTTDPVHNQQLAIIWNTPRKLMVHVGVSSNNDYNISNAEYNSTTGDLVLTSVDHKLTTNSLVGIKTDSLTFSCNQDDYATNHTYPRITDPAHTKVLGVTSTTDNTFTVNVGASQSGAGGELTFNIKNGGTYYVNPRITVSDPTYENLSVLGASRLGIGATSITGVGLSMTLDLAPPVDAGKRLRGPIPTPISNKHADASDLILTNRTMIAEVAVGRMLEKYSGNYEHRFVSATAGAVNKVSPSGSAITPNHAFFTPSTGVLKLTFASAHGLSDTNTIKLDTLSLKFTCGLDNHTSYHSYPRTTDPISGITTAIANVGGGGTDFTINVGQVLQSSIIPQYKTNSSVTNQDCIDDVSDILEVIAHNTQFDGNDKTVDAANLYITGAHVAGEEQETIYAFEQARDMAIQAIRNEKIGIGSGGQYEHKLIRTNTNALRTGGAYGHTFISAANNAVSITGGGSTTPSGATYDGNSGVLTLTFANAHGINNSNTVTIANHSLTFTCEGDQHASQHSYPRPSDPAYGNPLNVTSHTSSAPHQITVNVGVSTFVNVGVTTATYNPSTGDLVATVGAGHTILGPSSHTVTTCTYTPTTGVLRLTVPSHGFSNGDMVRILDESLTMTCGYDSHATTHKYPRTSDPASGKWLRITNVTTNTFKVNVGNAGISSAHTFVSATSNGLEKARTKIGISTESMTWTCSRDHHATEHSYPRTTDPYHNRIVSVASTTANTITFNVGVSSSNYTINDQYYDKNITGDQSGSKGVYTVGDCAEVASAVSTLTGIVTFAVGQSALPTKTASNPALFEVSKFELTKPGYAFMRGDTFKPVGLVTAANLVGNRFVHKFVGIGTNAIIVNGDNQVATAITTPTGANYNPATGDLVLITDNPHNISMGDTIGIATNSLTFTCAKDGHTSEHTYPRTTDPIHNNMSVGIGSTSVYTITINVGAAAAPSPRTELIFNVQETFNDSFAAWQLGEFDFIDSIKSLQNGVRTRFPLYKNSQLLSFQKNPSDVTSSLIDFDTILLIYVNGVMQEPKVAYEFTGGTTFTFTAAPLPDDDIDIFFYRGTTGVDSLEVNVNETVKPGDDLQIRKNSIISGTVDQDKRILSRILSSDQVETGIYLGDGIDDTNFKPIDWTKQKRDIIINDNAKYKSRDSIEGLVFPTANIIGDIQSNDDFFYVDDAQLFNYEENESDIDISDVDALIVPSGDPVSAAFTAVVSSAGTISSIDITSGGSGYTPGTINLDLSDPIGGIGTVFKTAVTGIGTLGIGSDVIMGIASTEGIEIGHTLKAISNVIGTDVKVTGLSTSYYLGAGATQYSTANVVSISTNASNTTVLVRTFDFGKYQNQTQATATATVSSAGTVSSTTITNPGSGYTGSSSTPYYVNGRSPSILSPIPQVNEELVTDIRFIEGYSGIITGITTSTGTTGAQSMALTFHVKHDSSLSAFNLDRLIVDTPIYISETGVGHGVTSIDRGGNTTIVGIGTTFADNIYKVHEITRNNFVGVITCNVHSGINTAGIPDNVNSITGITTVFGGKFSWGKLSGFTRSSSGIGIAVTGLTVNTGLTSFPTIQRRGYGLRDSGSLRKDLG